MPVPVYSAMAYAQPKLGLKSERAQEYEVIARITKNLNEAGSNLPFTFPNLVAALDENRRLWDVFALDVTRGENKLPSDLRAGIAALANFTKNHTRKILSGDAEVSPLIEINLAVMKGLSNNKGST
ncbi:MAG: flagellar biosynthesis regulator FlaF [Roseinatronobacter sp.]